LSYHVSIWEWVDDVLVPFESQLPGVGS